MRPFTETYGHDSPGLIDKLVPGLATMIDDVVEGSEDAVGEPIVAHELPDVFHRVELGRFWRQWDDGNVRRNDEPR